MTQILTASNLTVRIDDTVILDDVSLAVNRGDWVGVVGPNGSGKTTLLRTCNGFLPYSGDVEVCGSPLPLWNRRDLARRVAFVRQNHALAFEFLVSDLVVMGKTPHKGWLETTSDRDIQDVKSALEAVGLAGFDDRIATSLSGGELQRVFLAQALVQDAELLLLDEPTTHLDVYHQYDLLERVRGQVADGLSVVAVFHDLSQAWRYCDKILVLDGGSRVAFGHPQDVLDTALIRDVFRMEARLGDSDGVASITYLRTSQ